MAVVARRVALSTTPARLDQAGADTTAGSSLLAFHPGSVTIFVGPEGVTDNTGAAWSSGTLCAELAGGEALYGVLASGTATCHVLLAGV